MVSTSLTNTVGEAVSLQEHLKSYRESMAEVQERYDELEQEHLPDYSDIDDTVTTLSRDYVDVFADALEKRINPKLWNIEALQSEDSAKTDLELTCTLCREHLCDVEASDSISVLFSIAVDHIQERHSAPEGEEQHP